MFAYEGWINIGDIAGEMKNPKKISLKLWY